MKKLVFAALWAFWAIGATAQQVPKFSRATIFLDGRPMGELARLGLELDHGIIDPGSSVTNDFSENELKLVEAAGFRSDILIDDVVEHYRSQNESIRDRSAGACPDFEAIWPTPFYWQHGSMGGYKTLSEMLATLDAMQARFPNLITVKAPISSISTHEGRPIFYVKISDNPNADEAEPEVFFNAMHHAREPLGMEQLLFFMWHLLENYDQDPEIKLLVDNLELYFAPCVNPDGYEFNRQTDPLGGGLWRKNRRANPDGTFGVDLNRNYGFQWGFDNVGSSPAPGSDLYRGPAGFSEPETQAIRDFCEQREFRIALNYHTWGNLLIYPWGYADGATPDDATFARMAKWLRRQNNFAPGYSTQTVAYTVNGTSDDWMYGEQATKPKIFSFTPEVGRLNGFWPAEEDIDFLCKSTLWQNLTTCRMALGSAIFEDKSEALLPVALNGDLPFELHFAGLAPQTFNVSVEPLSAKILSASAASSFDLSEAQPDAIGKIQYSLSSDVAQGDELFFKITVSSGAFFEIDTLRKAYGGKVVRKIDDDFDGVSTLPWLTVSGQWALTTEDFHSPPSSMTDSPFGQYFDESELVYSDLLQVSTDAESARLRFWAKWAIAPRFDFAAVRADGQALCGRYTGFASDWQEQLGMPVYDGFQNEWVEEEIDLMAFKGQSFQLSVTMKGDFGVGDGFYFDDFRFEEVLADGSVRTETLDEKGFEMSASPNPTSDRAVVDFGFKKAVERQANLLVFNALGEKMACRPIDLKAHGRIELNVSDWPAGLYFLEIEAEGLRSAPKRLAVAH